MSLTVNIVRYDYFLILFISNGKDVRASAWLFFLVVLKYNISPEISYDI